MDALVAMQKIFRRTAVQDSSLPSGSDVFLKPTKEPQPVQSTVKGSSQNIRISSLGPISESAQEPFPKATIPIRKVLLRSFSEYSSSLRPMSILSAKRERYIEKDVILSRTMEETSFSTVGTEVPHRAWRESTIWSDDDHFLPRAKPPPPLKRVKHTRNRSDHNALPNSEIPSRPSIQRGSSRGSAISDSTHSLLPRRSFDGPALKMLRGAGNMTPDVPLPMMETATREAKSFEESAEELTFAPCDLDWQPPTNWAGPSQVASVQEDNKSRLRIWLTRRKSGDSSKAASTRIPAHARSLKKLRPAQAVVTEALKEEEDSAMQEEPLSSGVVVKIQCYEDDGWHEKPMVDIIPKLRELKIK